MPGLSPETFREDGGKCITEVVATNETIDFPCGAVIWATGWRPYDAAKIQPYGCDRNYLMHCSRICCMASLKHCNYVAEAYGEVADISVYDIDIRSIDHLEDFYEKVKKIEQAKFVKSKPAAVVSDKGANPVVHGVDTEGYKRFEDTQDLVVLAVGMEPSVDKDSFPVDIVINREGFIEAALENGGAMLRRRPSLLRAGKVPGDGQGHHRGGPTTTART